MAATNAQQPDEPEELPPPPTAHLPPPTSLLLASASPRRRELLAALGLPFDVRALDVDETPPAGLSPLDTVRAIAARKADAAVALAPAGATVLVADTIVAIDNRVLGKPANAGEARAMLSALAGRPHEVYTAVVLAAGGWRAEDAPRTTVLMRPYTDAEIAASIAAGTPFDKAGGYAIQDPALHPVARCDGCYCNVMGLPLWTVRRLLALHPAPPLRPPDETYARCAACPLRN